MKDTFLEPLKDLPEYGEIRERMKKHKGIISLTGCLEAQRAHMAYGLSFDMPCTVFVTENELAARNFYENYRFYEPETLIYPAKDLLFYEADVKGDLLDRQRLTVLSSLSAGRKTTVILPAAALMDRITQKSDFEAGKILLLPDDEHDLTALSRELVGIGYKREAAVDMPGQFAVRGDILDIWNMSSERPVRVEFFGDSIEDIRTFDPETQRSSDHLEDFSVEPAADRSFGAFDSFLSWFDKEETALFLVEPNRVAEALKAAETEYTESVKNRVAQGTFEADKLPEILSFEELLAVFERFGAIALSALDISRKYFDVTASFGTTARSVTAYQNHFDLLIHDILRYREAGYRIVLISGSHSRAERLAEDLRREEIPAFYSDQDDRALRYGEVMVRYGRISRGFDYPAIRFAVISDSDIFGEEQKRRPRKTKPSGEHISSFSELAVGDFVVHENYGLGIYRGIEKMTVQGAVKDYIKLEYKGSNLYILATQLDRLQKYAGGSEDHAPRLNRIGGNEWKNTKTRVRKAVADIARQLVALYATRQAVDGYRCGPDTPWQREFEELFPYEETEDQLTAIEETKRDMESTKIMDRLICGDVGYGKTEVALRAAFKAVQESRQVAILVPTTILAQQHYKTFSQRMKDFPVRVDILSRFRTPAEIQKTIRDLKAGLVDVVIGTHRLLSKDVTFKNLGLLVVDEEQRFGVTHKEKIKELRKNVDVLTLTATPIPRTLHMSLIGIRDMSVLEEPPRDRQPIQTYVLEYNDELVREAICRELNRGGQVYYVYNRVRDITEAARRIRLMVPEARVAFAHGQMAENELEKVMVDFINGEIDVLVTTTIIETGLDIANVNTMVIQDADRMGLSQLYQLRGRIGRSGRTAYAYLMYRRDKVLREEAEKRLAAIREFTELGSGIRIAMKDLEIRGAGNLLGAEQSGHMGAVGYDLYCKMLNEAVRIAKGEKAEEEDFETVVDLVVTAFIPDSYIRDSYQKIDIYKRIAAIENKKDYEDMSDELMDRFGKLPLSVTQLLRVALIKAIAHRASITEIKETGHEVRLGILKEPAFDPGGLPGLLRKWRGDFVFRMSADSPCFLYVGDRAEKVMLDNLEAFVSALAQL